MNLLQGRVRHPGPFREHFLVREGQIDRDPRDVGALSVVRRSSFNGPSTVLGDSILSGGIFLLVQTGERARRGQPELFGAVGDEIEILVVVFVDGRGLGGGVDLDAKMYNQLVVVLLIDPRKIVNELLDT